MLHVSSETRANREYEEDNLMLLYAVGPGFSCDHVLLGV